jgi:hypothetical protein
LASLNSRLSSRWVGERGVIATAGAPEVGGIAEGDALDIKSTRRVLASFCLRNGTPVAVAALESERA